VPVLRVSSRTGAGLAELWQTIAALPLRRGARTDAAEVLRLTCGLLAARFAAARSSPAVQAVVEGWRKGTMSADEAAARVLEVLATHASSSG
jgi:hypothetical protein